MIRTKTLQLLYVGVGHTSMVIGIAGVFLPLIPSVPFFLLAAFCYERGSPELHRKLMESKRIGPHIRRWKTSGAIATRVKVLASVMLIGGIGLSVYNIPAPWARAMLISIGSVALLYILSRPTRKG